MRLKTLCILMAAGIGALGVSGLAAVQSTLQEPPARPEVTHRPNDIEPSSAYTAWRWIGLLHKGKTICPQVPGWELEPPVAQPLDSRYEYLSQASREQAAADRALIHKLGLDRFCVYNRLATKPFVAPSDLMAAKPDRIAIAASGTSLPAGVGDSQTRMIASVLVQELENQTGHLQFQLTPNEWNVQLTFIDGQPDQDPISSAPPLVKFQHGFMLGHLAQNLVCDEHDHCAAKVTSRRALNYGDPEHLSQRLPTGEVGRIGVIGELADVIMKQVLDWRQSSRPRHLILNLSIGWDGENELAGLKDLDAHRVSELEPSVQRVYAALQFASRNGVLVIASAGNRQGGSLHDSNWPLLPAAWAQRRPSCSLFGSQLVYAAGGVDWQGLPLPNSRTRGLPQRVAYGDHAAAKVDLGNGQITTTGIFTGSSVSAAVVSSVAAMIWHLRPELQPDEVMRLIDRSASRQEARADFYAWRDIWPLSLLPAPQLREVSMCAAVERACGPDGKHCHGLILASALQCKPLVHQPPVLPKNLVPTLQAVALPYNLVSPPPPLSPPCHPNMQLLTRNEPAPPDTCPTDEYRSVLCRRWVLPQPRDNPCPSCSIIPPPSEQHAALSLASINTASSATPPNKKLYNLAITISPEWQVSLESATLDIDRFVHGEMVKRMTYPIFKKGQTIPNMVPGLGDGESLDGCRAQLNFVVRNIDGTTMSVQSPVLVDP